MLHMHHVPFRNQRGTSVPSPHTSLQVRQLLFKEQKVK